MLDKIGRDRLIFDQNYTVFGRYSLISAIFVVILLVTLSYFHLVQIFSLCHSSAFFAITQKVCKAVSGKGQLWPLFPMFFPNSGCNYYFSDICCSPCFVAPPPQPTNLNVQSLKFGQHSDFQLFSRYLFLQYIFGV